MRYRQIHLDFHTSELIPDVGARFDAGRFQQALTAGHVDSITLFSLCHHGWTYHPTTAGRIHPTLKRNLLGEQIAAAHAIGVRTPVYVSAGLNEQTYWRHPQWARRQADGSVPWAGRNDRAGFHELCMNTPYLDQLAAHVEEVARTYGEHGIFLDIVSPRACWCNTCVIERSQEGDPRDQALIDAQARRTYLRYTRRMRQAADAGRPGVALFHNGGHIVRGDRELARENSHLELESLPTGGWGYDHFPVSASYARVIGMPFLGMTGKFHTSWGEFGGFKHPNALRYEAAMIAALGGRMSVGDQCHPDADLDPTTYAIVGSAYAELAAKEPWLSGAVHRADVAVLSHESVRLSHGGAPTDNIHDTGAARMLLEGHILFDVIDAEVAFDGYRVLVLPDDIRLDRALSGRVRAFVAGGGRVLATGTSALDPSGAEALDLGSIDGGAEHAFDPDYLQTEFDIAPWGRPAQVIYAKGRVLRPTGEILARWDHPYFQRDLLRFCSHQHTPNRRQPADPAITRGADGIRIGFAACEQYARKGQVILREVFLHALRRLLPAPLVTTDLPATGGRITVTRQEAQRRDIVHLVYGTPSKRGEGIEPIEDLPPLANVQLQLRRSRRPSSVTLAPSGEPLPFSWQDGVAACTVPQLRCHAMVVMAD